MRSKIRVAVVQHKGGERGDCHEQTRKGINDAAIKGANLILLQELHAGNYFCQSEDKDNFSLSESLDGETVKLLCLLAKKHGCVIVGSVFEKRGIGIYHNTAIVIEKTGEVAGKYRKMHIPDDPGYYEKYYFTPGDLGFEPIQTSVGRLGILVCWDQWFPEAARIMALKGANFLLYPTAIGFYPDDDQETRRYLVDAWTTVQRGHSISNCLPVIVCNRTGFEPDISGATKGIEFWGSSFITDAHGQILAKASENESEVLVADIDLKQTEEKRIIWPYLRDRRTDAYGDILKKFVD